MRTDTGNNVMTTQLELVEGIEVIVSQVVRTLASASLSNLRNVLQDVAMD